MQVYNVYTIIYVKVKCYLYCPFSHFCLTELHYQIMMQFKAGTLT